jgi:hypothetical protein
VKCTEGALLHVWARDADGWHEYVICLERDPCDGGRWAKASALRPLDEEGSQTRTSEFGRSGRITKSPAADRSRPCHKHRTEHRQEQPRAGSASMNTSTLLPGWHALPMAHRDEGRVSSSRGAHGDQPTRGLPCPRGSRALGQARLATWGRLFTFAATHAGPRMSGLSFLLRGDVARSIFAAPVWVLSRTYARFLAVASTFSPAPVEDLGPHPGFSPDLSRALAQDEKGAPAPEAKPVTSVPDPPATPAAPVQMRTL